ncbi:MAG: glycoside hydrolase family 3 C-terminal domain-containing protein [Armatimonadota bacterium]
MKPAIILGLLVGTFCASLCSAVPYEKADQRALELLKKMTLEEKLSFIGGGNTGLDIKPIPRLGIPQIIMSDGPSGVRCYGPAAALPGGLTLAASWNKQLAHEYGVVMGKEARARGVHIMLGPGVNITRSPMAGRSFEYFGEDPYLASEITVPWITGLQSQEVLATVKHFAANNQEWDRNGVSSEVDERTLREIYFPAFEAAVTRAHTGCVMDSYNLVNGKHASENDFLQNQVLKKDWGFNGILMSDWGAAHNAIGCALGGLDLEMPNGAFMNEANLKEAVLSGKVPERIINDKVRRILRTCIAANFFDRPQTLSNIPKDNPASDAFALKGALEGMVLLKNNKNFLPLDRNKVKQIAVVGPNAHPAVFSGGGSGYTSPFRAVSIFDGIKAVVSNSSTVSYASASLPIGTAVMEVFDNKLLEGKPVYTAKTEAIDYHWTNGNGPGLSKGDNFSVRWTFTAHPKKTGVYEVSTNSDDGARVFVNGKKVIDNWTDHATTRDIGSARLEAKDNLIVVEYYQGAGESVMQFGWRPFVTADEQLAGLAKMDAVVYCAGLNDQMEGEGHDHAYGLPAAQLMEIQKIAKINPNIVVVINSGCAMSWDGWLDKVPAVLQAWYPGQEVGRAVADILFGEVNPSGKLPVSFEKRQQDNPSYPYYSINKKQTTPYTEGIFMGYRGYDKKNITPMFPFGYGLSYTSFKLSNIKITLQGIRSARKVLVSCKLTNTGKRAGAEVVQLYVGDPKCSVPRPIRELKGFEKMQLEPGKSTQVSFTLSPRDLSFYDVKSHSWVAEPGLFNVYVGNSSRNLPLRGSFTW